MSTSPGYWTGPWLSDWGQGPLVAVFTHAPESWKHNFPPTWRKREGLSLLKVFIFNC